MIWSPRARRQNRRGDTDTLKDGEDQGWTPFDLFAARFLAICTRHTYIDEQLEMERKKVIEMES